MQWRIGRGIAITLLLLASCGGEDSAAEPVDPNLLLQSSADAMAAVQSAGFEMNRTGAEVTVEGMTFDGAVGQYAAPDSARALLRLRAGDLAVELGTISVGERTWLTNPLTGGWEELEPGTGFNPAVIFASETGWPLLLTSDISSVEYLGSSGSRHLLRGTVAGDRIGALTAGLAADQPVVLEMEIESDTSRLLHLEFETSGDEGASSWVIDLFDYDEPVGIDPPGTG